MAAENGGVPEAEVVQNRQFISTNLWGDAVLVEGSQQQTRDRGTRVQGSVRRAARKSLEKIPLFNVVRSFDKRSLLVASFVLIYIK